MSARLGEFGVQNASRPALLGGWTIILSVHPGELGAIIIVMVCYVMYTLS